MVAVMGVVQPYKMGGHKIEPVEHDKIKGWSGEIFGCVSRIHTNTFAGL